LSEDSDFLLSSVGDVNHFDDSSYVISDGLDQLSDTSSSGAGSIVTGLAPYS